MAGALLLVGLKLAYDLVSLGREHRNAAQKPARENPTAVLPG